MLIAQLSDTHIQTGPLAGEPARLLHRALGRILTLDRTPDCVVITGDVANDGTEEQYAAFREIVGRFPLPLHLLPGNHDDPKVMAAVFGRTGYLAAGDATHYVVDYPDVAFIALDSNIPGSNNGRIGTEQLAWLDHTLAGTEKPVVIGLHHPPVPVGLPFLDAMSLDNPDDLAAVLRKHSQIVLLMAGHVHRTIFATLGGVPVTVAPSTYRQAALDLVTTPPSGYLHETPGLLVHLIENGRAVSHYVPTDVPGAELGYF